MDLRPLTQGELLEGTIPEERDLLLAHEEQFLKKTPLWYYILKESETRSQGNHVGPMGSRIIVEVFYRMTTKSKNAYLKVKLDWTPSVGDGEDFGMIDLLEFAGVIEAA